MAKWAAHNYQVTIGPRKTLLVRDGVPCFEADAGVVVRNYQLENSRLSFTLISEHKVRISAKALGYGDFYLEIDGGGLQKSECEGKEHHLWYPGRETSCRFS